MKDILTLYGGDQTPAPKQTVLSAGPLRMIYENGDLRYIRLGSREVLRMIYVAVRDQHWGTLRPEIRHEEIVRRDESFHISYERHYHHQDIHWIAFCTITGHEDGTVLFSVDGTAQSSFLSNRIGCCVLHPIRECQGQPCTVTTVTGETIQGIFPRHVSPHQPFQHMRAICWQVSSDCDARLELTGDTFEMEDQRNWTDASYKIYSRPLTLPFPFNVRQGDRTRQSVRLQLAGVPAVTTSEEAMVAIFPTGGVEDTMPLPAIGVSRRNDKATLTDREAALLRRIGFSHYRVVLRLYESEWQQQWAAALTEARQLALPLEVVLYFSDDISSELSAFIRESQHIPEALYSLLVLHDAHKTTPDALLRQVVPVLKSHFPATPTGAGTDANFAELNRYRPQTDLVDFLSYPVNPQVHAFDAATLVENLKGQSYTVESAHQFAGGKAIHISPVTLLPQSMYQDGGPAADPRQRSLLGAGWTLGSMKYLAEAGAASITYYETAGRRGIIPADEPLPESVRQSRVFPLYFVLREVLRDPAARIVPARSTHPLKADGLVLSGAQETRLLLANYTKETLPVRIHGEGSRAQVSYLDEDNLSAAMADPETFTEAGSEPLEWTDGTALIFLKPYALSWVYIDFNVYLTAP